MNEKITLAHGAGGQISRELLEKIILPTFDNSMLNVLHDGAIINSECRMQNAKFKLAFTTDSYVIRPIFFNGGDIGKISICGTVNDLAMSGSIPKFLSVGMIIEEGFLIDDLKKIVHSMRSVADEVGVKIVTGDTKVVAKGQADGIFINTAGIGEVIDGVTIDPRNVKVGMKILISGMIGDHSASILASRHALKLNLKSDCAPLSDLVEKVLKVAPNIPTLRDPTRGGVAAVLNEIASASNVGILIDEEVLPIREEVQGVCDILGFDPLELANEGKFIAFVPPENVDKVLKIMHNHKYGIDAAVIGEVVNNSTGRVGLKTSIGSIRIVDMPLGAIVPRIC
ncbi:MAG: hydrogenase expression/formation protein HypE [Selenomonadaceae bacterium]|nr:hydrogenase expression/formation protein HypE [Selenomonadaceae bacterium]